jgi:hypothetical protein
MVNFGVVHSWGRTVGSGGRIGLAVSTSAVRVSYSDDSIFSLAELGVEVLGTSWGGLFDNLNGSFTNGWDIIEDLFDVFVDLIFPDLWFLVDELLFGEVRLESVELARATGSLVWTDKAGTFGAFTMSTD